MKNHSRTLFILILSGILFYACKKSEPETNVVKCAINAPDSIVFDNFKTIQLPFVVNRISGASQGEFSINLNTTNAPGFAIPYADLIVGNEKSASLQVFYSGSTINPGVYSAILTANQVNVNNPELASKTIYLVMRPGCAFPFRNFINGSITYSINGILLHKAVQCNYELDNTLSVDGLGVQKLYLIFNCTYGTISVKPQTVSGTLYGGTGSFTATKISLTLTANGVQNAIAEITP